MFAKVSFTILLGLGLAGQSLVADDFNRPNVAYTNDAAKLGWYWQASGVNRIRPHGLFVCGNEDVEARNLIDFLGVNRQEVFEERANHIDHIRHMRQMVGDGILLEILNESPEQLSFPTAIEAELKIPAFDMITRYIE